MAIISQVATPTNTDKYLKKKNPFSGNELCNFGFEMYYIILYCVLDSYIFHTPEQNVDHIYMHNKLTCCRFLDGKNKPFGWI